MRVKIIIGFVLAISMNSMALTAKDIIVERSPNGIISSVKYPREDNEAVPENSASFFANVLKVRNDDSFLLQHSSKAKYGMRFERYTQFYRGIEVDGGFYSFRYKNGRLLAACGNYVSTEKIKTTPSIKEEDAIIIFSKYMEDKISDIGDSHIKLVIIEKPNSKEAVLAYKIYFETSSIHTSEIGYIDAHTGDIIYTLPTSICYSAFGTFYTLYNNNSPKMARTEYAGGNTGFILYDSTRGNGIHTFNGTGDVTSDFCDTNNIWTASEMGSCQMGLDVHWTLQQIYDVLNNEYGHCSFDGANAAINACVISGRNTSFHPYYNEFHFGQGDNLYGPMASVDIIGHEFGHAILYHTTHWQNSYNDIDALHEGFSDVWGILFEQRITPNSDIWKTGEDVVIGYDCARDFAYPNNPNALLKIASTYNCGLYFTDDVHVKGGIASRWFHLLVNGGNGTNEKGDTYTVSPVGFDLAEELFTYTVLNNSYLDNCSTFMQVRQAFEDAACDMDNPFLAMQVANAWYAVGVGSQPTQISLSGTTVICPDTASTYMINNLPSGFTINWSIDNNNFSISPSGYQCFVTYTGTPQYSVANLTATIMWNGTTVKTLTKRIVMHGTDLVAYGEQDGYVSSNGTFPSRSFTIPANNGLRNIPEGINREVFADKESLPINFIEDNTRDLVRPRVDLCGYGITDINGGNRVYLNSDRFDGMDISFSSLYRPTYFYHSGSYVSFEMPYNSPNYPVILQAESNGHCHDFCLTFNVIPLPGVLSGDDIIWVNLDGSMLYVSFRYGGEPVGNGQYYFPNYTVTIRKIPGGTQVYSNTFDATQTSFSINTSSWASGIYSIRIVCNGNSYSKTICL